MFLLYLFRNMVVFTPEERCYRTRPCCALSHGLLGSNGGATLSSAMKSILPVFNIQVIKFTQLNESCC